MVRNMEKAADSLTQNTEAVANLRFERKYVYQNTHFEDLIQRVYLNSFGFKEVFHKRKINNIYFDDSNYNFYKQNVEGVANRKKLRLRWYGYDTAQIIDPTIEVKKKMGEVGDKDSYRLKGTSLNLNVKTANDIQAYLIENTHQYIAINQSLKALHPTLLNTYERRYFLSLCGRYRITVDFNQAFYNPNYRSFEHSELQLNAVVLELKYAVEDDTDARQVSQQINTRLSKNSKYVTGIDMLYHTALL